MNGRTWICLAIGVVLDSFLMAVVFHDSPERESVRLKRQIDAGLPVGAVLKDVEKWLTARELTFHPATNVEGTSRTITVRLYREYFWTGYLSLEFSFDEKGRLTGDSIRWFEFSL